MLAVTACGGDDPIPTFNAEAWRTASVEVQATGSMLTSPNERCQLVDQISDVLAAGMSVDEVTAELGEMNMTADGDRLTYTLGVCGMGVDYDFLSIFLDDGRVKDWRVVQG
jgi:hypothetical protein